MLIRIFSSLFAYPITPQTGFHYLMMLYFLYQYSNRLEKDDFAGKPADMSYMLLIIYAVTSKLQICHKCHFNKSAILNPRFMPEYSILFESFSIFFLGHVYLAFPLTNIADII